MVDPLIRHGVDHVIFSSNPTHMVSEKTMLLPFLNVFVIKNQVNDKYLSKIMTLISIVSGPKMIFLIRKTMTRYDQKDVAICS